MLKAHTWRGQRALAVVLGSREKERDGFEALREMDALHAVSDGILYPAVLLTTGLKDPRVTFDAGHGLGSTRTQADEQRADEYAFVLWRTGAPGFQPAL